MIGRNGLMWTRESLKRTQTGPELFHQPPSELWELDANQLALNGDVRRCPLNRKHKYFQNFYFSEELASLPPPPQTKQH